MTGSLLQLVAKGVQDMYLINNPQITTFKIVYRRHIGFSLFDKIISSKSSPSVQFSSDLSIKIDRDGDLLSKIYAVIDLPDILIKNIDPTFECIGQILKNYNIQNNIKSGHTATDIVSLNNYNNTITDIINKNIEFNIEAYNFYNNAMQITSNSNYIISQTTDSLNRFNDTSDSQHVQTVSFYKTYITTGVHVTLTSMILLLSKYSNYKINLSYLTSNYNTEITNNDQTIFSDNTLTTTRIIKMYTDQNKQIFISYSITLGLIRAYMLDSIIYNCYNDSVINTADNFVTSHGLFTFLYREQGDAKNLIKLLQLYNSDVFRYKTYFTYLNNIIRIFLINSGTQIFSIKYYHNVDTSNTISHTNNELQYFLPDRYYFNLSILFYHSIDPQFSNISSEKTLQDTLFYDVYKFNIGQQTRSFFNNIISTFFTFNDAYNTVPFTDYTQTSKLSDLGYSNITSYFAGGYEITDAYKIYNAYMKIIENDIANSTIQSTEQLYFLGSVIKSTIDTNIKYNFIQLQNIMSIIYTSNPLYWTSHYILSFFKTFKYNKITDIYIPSSGSGFAPVTNSPILELNDNFMTVLNNFKIINNITNNFFNNDVNINFDIFIKNCLDSLRVDNYDDYMNYYPIWTNILFIPENNYSSTIYDICTSAGLPMPISEPFGTIAHMNYIPLVAAKHIPLLVFKTFTQYMGSVFDKYGLGTAGYYGMKQSIDIRDNSDMSAYEIDNGGAPAYNVAFKNAIYTKMANASYLQYDLKTGNKILLNGKYFNKMKQKYGTSDMYILNCSLEQTTFFTAYSTWNGDSLVDVDSSYTWLPIEWLTQTYYKRYSSNINAYVDTLNTLQPSQRTELKTIFIGLLTNIINCFVCNNTISPLNDYQKNGYNLLGLLPETSTIFNTLNIPPINANYLFSTTPIYCDAISSIWYQVQKKMIQLYNKLFNNLLLSATYYTQNLGVGMMSIFDFIKTVIRGKNGNTIENKYYGKSPNDQYVGNIVGSILYISAQTQEINPPIEKDIDTGFDFYRILNINYGKYIIDPNGIKNEQYNNNLFYTAGPSQTLTTFNQDVILQYIKDTLSLYTYTLDKYARLYPILNLKNDDNNWKTNTSGIRNKSTFFYETASTITSYIEEHVIEKYITHPNVFNTQNPLNDSVNSDNAISIIQKTHNYWDPVNGNSKVYGILDILFNTNINNLFDTISKIYNGQNGFQSDTSTTFFLHDYARSLISTINGNHIYVKQNATDVKTLIDSIKPIFTSTYLIDNKFLEKTYNTNGNIFNDASQVILFVFNEVLNKLCNEHVQTYNDKSLFQNITLFDCVYKGVTNISPVGEIQDSGATKSVNNLYDIFSSPMNSYLTQLKKITTFKQVNPPILINNFNSFFNTIYDQLHLDNSLNIDINFYITNTTGDYINGSSLEKVLLDLINNKQPEFAWVKELGHKIMSSIELTIGGQSIDTQYTPELLHFIYTMIKDKNHERGYNIMIGNTEEMYVPSSSQRSVKRLYIPLKYWFCNEFNNPIPLINMMYSDIIINIKINDLNQVLYKSDTSYFIKQPKIKCSLLVTYMYIEEQERKRMSENKLEYLIEKFNYNGKTIFTRSDLLKTVGISDDDKNININDVNPIMKIKLKISDPTKYLIWCIKIEDKTTEISSDIINWNSFGYNVRDTNGKLITHSDLLDGITIYMNGVKREQTMKENYFKYLIPYSKQIGSFEDGQYMYSFALYPLILQPSGTANFSELEDSHIELILNKNITQLLLDNPNLKISCEVWGCSYNIFRVLSGIGALAFFKVN